MQIERLDHLVLTVASIDRTIHFYQEILGMGVITFGQGRRALTFGNQKINLHEKGKEFEPKAKKPEPGSADLCFISKTPIPNVLRELQAANVVVEEGPIERTGAVGKILSVYIRDPDSNLIEISNYI